MSKTLLIASVVVLLAAFSVVASSCKPVMPPLGTGTPGLTPNTAPGTTPASTPNPVETASIEELKQKLESGHNFTLLDVRPGTDFDRGHIDGALSMPLQDMPNRYGEVSQSPEVIVYTECA